MRELHRDLKRRRWELQDLKTAARTIPIPISVLASRCQTEMARRKPYNGLSKIEASPDLPVRRKKRTFQYTLINGNLQNVLE